MKKQLLQIIASHTFWVFIGFIISPVSYAQLIKTSFADDSTTIEYEFEGTISGKDTTKTGNFKHFFEYSKGLYETGKYTDNKKNGEFITYYEHGNKHWVRNYSNGLLDGEETYYNNFGNLLFKGKYKQKSGEKGVYSQYYPSGEMKKTVGMLDNLADGIEYNFARNGDTLSMKTFENGIMNGDFWIKNDKNELVQTGKYEHNKLIDSVKSYYTATQLKSIGQFGDGVPNGEMKDYFANGQLKRICNYVMDTLNGECQTYYENGQLYAKAYFFKGFFDKTYLEYYENGILKDSINYNRSQKNGESKHFAEDGKLYALENFKNGIYHGHQLRYYPDGTTKMSDFNYKDGYKTGENYTYFLDSKKESILIFDSKDQISIQKSFYSNQKLKTSTKHSYKKTVSEDQKTKNIHIAKEKNYYENGTLKTTGTWIDDKKNGIWVFYNPEKTKYKIETYKNDKLHGEYIEYYPNKKIKEQGQYILGNKSGVWTKFAKDASITEKSNYKNSLLDGEYYLLNHDNEEVKGFYKKGRKEGTWIISINGKEIRKENYLKGELIDKK